MCYDRASRGNVIERIRFYESEKKQQGRRGGKRSRLRCARSFDRFVDRFGCLTMLAVRTEEPEIPRR